MEIQELQKQLETEKDVEFSGNCHDCDMPVKVLCSTNENGEIVISGGAVYTPLNTEQPFFKCDKCFQSDKVLRNWRECEVYSRVVGYIRPVKQWNKGKREEYNQRKEFVVEKG